MQTETILYIIIAGIIALSLALFQYLYKSKQKGSLYKVLAFLRFLTLFLILLLLINPKFESVSFYNEKPNLVIAVDNTQSISYLNQAENTSKIIEYLAVNDSLKERFNVEIYAFGKNLRTLDSLNFSEKQSNLSNVFKQLSEIYNTSISPTVIITDGNQTYGADYQLTSSSYKQPIYPVILGDTITYSDLKIEQLNVNRYAYLKNRFPVEVIAVYSGNEAVNTELKISQGTTVVHSERLRFDNSNTSRVVTITLPANSVGVNSFRAELTALENERNTANNIKNFAVEVIDQKTHVAIISDVLHPDLGALKKSIESNEQRSVSLLTPAEFMNNSTAFQMAILYQPNSSFRLVFEELDRLNMNRFLVVGTITDWQFLNSIQSYYQQEETGQTEEFQPELNLNFSGFIIDDLDFSEFPPLQTEFGKTQINVPVQIILNKTINGIQINEPLLAIIETNTKKEAFLNGEGIWRWRSQHFLNTKSFDAFDNVIGKLVQYLSSNQTRSRLSLNYESFYNGNDDVTLKAQYFNKNFEFDSNASLTIRITNDETKSSREFPFVLKNNNYQVDLSSLEPGDYEFTVSVTNENMSRSGKLKILDYNVEQQFLNADVTKLNALATQTNGNAYFINHTSQLVKNLVLDNRYVTVQKSTKNIVPLIDWKYLLILIAMSLTCEWFIRKYNGLI
ncbi:VWA domain-containing protein [Geojedonia litorea]|uniref:VWA domain-containing protein n=1 Tax=Geojedonia litorea TaxID=1268269 RepID=A0ABV9N0W5_9FLAO